jgi:hypothetical protein
MNMTIKEKINEAIRENLEAEGYSLSSEDWMVSTDKILSLIQKRLLKAIDMHLYGSTWSNHYLEAMNKTRSIIKFELSSNLESK